MTGATFPVDGAISLPRVEIPPVVGQLARYAVVGGLGTAANAVIFLVLRTWFDTLPANLAALVLSTLLSTEVNRRFTFGASVAAHPWRLYVQNGGTVVFYAFYSSAVLIGLAVLVDGPSPLTESIAVATASLLGGLARFLVMRHWVFSDARTA